MTYNLHPFLSSFPIVLFTILAFTELYRSLSLKFFPKFFNKEFFVRFSILIAWLGCTISVLTLLSGYLAAENANLSFQINSDFIARHQSIAKLCLFLEIPLLVFLHLREHNKLFKLLYQGILLIILALMLYTGYLGAELVFKHGAGVNVDSEISTSLGY